jgi:metallo-beta-lactamase family protein
VLSSLRIGATSQAIDFTAQSPARVANRGKNRYKCAMDIQFYSHGACHEVTGSKHFLNIAGTTLQIDGGMFQGKREEAYRKNEQVPFNPAEVHAIILTHAHFDHSGALPLMVKKGFDKTIYSTPATRDVAQIVLLDSAHIQEKDAEYLHDKSAKHPDRQLVVYNPLYTVDDVLQTMDHFMTANYHRPFQPLPGLDVTLHDAGHILGSAMVHIAVKDGPRIAFSGDLGRSGLPIIRDPELLPEFDYLVLESTYGNRLHKSIGFGKDELASVIRKAYDRGGKIIIPAFTIERTQELIYLMHILFQEQGIPQIPIYVDSPMAVNATAIFRNHPECFDQDTLDRFVRNHMDPFGFDMVHYVTTINESMEINTRKGPAVIISASGMAESGRIQHHLANHIENPDNIIAIVGFMADNTLGRKLVERAPEVKIFGKPYQVKAEIVTLNAFSGHADIAEIIKWLGRHPLASLKKVFLVHGEDDALLNEQAELKKLAIPEVEIVDYGRVYRL